MPAFTLEIPHNLGRQGARARLESFLEKISEKYKGQIGDLTGNWEGDQLHFAFATFGIKITGKIEVLEDKVLFHGELPFSAMIFKGKISGGIKEALERALTVDKQGT
jgi:putative polyhydroxyalkanoate system protein